MRTIIICALLCLVIALSLPLIFSSGRDAAAPESASAAPETPETAASDAGFTFTVLTGGEVKTVTLAE